MTWLQSLALAILQGVSELFPVSSLGHTALIPALLRWSNIDRSRPTFLAFIVFLHFGTACALIAYYWKEWAAIVSGVCRSVARGSLSDDKDEKVGWLLIVGTIPVGIAGVLFEKTVRMLFASPFTVAIFLLINGVIMVGIEALKRGVSSGHHRQIHELSWLQAVIIGSTQTLALLPGISRSGVAMVGGLMCNLDHEDAAHFAFLLATPVILAASIFEVGYLFDPTARGFLLQSIVGGLVAGVSAYLSVVFLLRYFKNHNLRVFGVYCILFSFFAMFVLSRP